MSDDPLDDMLEEASKPQMPDAIVPPNEKDIKKLPLDPQVQQMALEALTLAITGDYKELKQYKDSTLLKLAARGVSLTEMQVQSIKSFYVMHDIFNRYYSS